MKPSMIALASSRRSCGERKVNYSSATGCSRASATGASRFRSTSRSPVTAIRARATAHDRLREADRVPDSELPLLLPELEDYAPGDAGGPAGKALDWRFFQQDGQWFARETNTMPQWAGSCWYYLRFSIRRTTRSCSSSRRYDDWMPVDLYVGGTEHAVLHLLYARFWHKVLFDLGRREARRAVPEARAPGHDPGRDRVHAVSRRRRRARVRAIRSRRPRRASTARQSLHRARPKTKSRSSATSSCSRRSATSQSMPRAFKMSKSRGNVVNPDEIVARYGADAFRLYEMFMGPLEQVKPWNTRGVEGTARFLSRAWRLLSGAADDDETGGGAAAPAVSPVQDVEPSASSCACCIKRSRKSPTTSKRCASTPRSPR